MKLHKLFIFLIALTLAIGIKCYSDSDSSLIISSDSNASQNFDSKKHVAHPIFKKHYVQYARWTSPPIVKVCKDVNISRQEVEEAVRWWEARGYAFDGIMYGMPCLNNILPGHIVIDIHNQESFPDNRNDLGTTYTHVQDGTDDIYAASIYILQLRERVLVHELGHALGWNHIQRIGHIMHGTWVRGGWEDSHVRRQCNQ